MRIPIINRSFFLTFIVSLWACGAPRPVSDLVPDSSFSDCRGKKRPKTFEERKTINQGVFGNIWFWEGDFMPVCESGLVTGVAREVYFFEPVTRGAVRQVTNSSLHAFYAAVTAQVIARTQSDADGFFQTPLTAGTYSMFVKEQGDFYANSFGELHFSPVVVEDSKATYKQFDITYDATY